MSYGGAALPPPLSDTEWLEISSLDPDFDAGLREAVETVVAEYFGAATLEIGAATTKDASAALRQISATASQLLNQLEQSESADTAYAQHLLLNHIRHELLDGWWKTKPGVFLKDPLIRAREIVAAVRDAAGIGLQQLAHSDYVINPGDAWNNFILGLTSVFRMRGLSTAARKDSDKNTSSGSLFVEFVWRLQLRFPKEFQRHQHSRDALAKAIAHTRKRTRAKA